MNGKDRTYFYVIDLLEYSRALHPEARKVALGNLLAAN
jgi:hypothetical protein